MKSIHFLSAIIFGAMVVVVPTKAFADAILNNGFEDPDLGSGGSAYGYGDTYGGQDPAGTVPTSYPALPATPSGWIFIGASGIAANGSDLGLTGATNGNSDGTMSTAGQAAFIQSTNGLTKGGFIGALSVPAGEYTISFDEEGSAGGSDEIHVFYNGQSLYTGTPDSASSFNSVTSAPFHVSASIGSGTGGAGAGKVTGLTFVGLSSNSGDFTTFIDNVTITPAPVPEPADWAWIAVAGTLGWVTLRRIRRQAVI